MEVTDTQMSTSPNAASSSAVPLDMSLSNKVSVEQCDDASEQEHIFNNINESEISPFSYCLNLYTRQRKLTLTTMQKSFT